MQQGFIMKETHQRREQYSAQFNHDLNAIFADTQRRQQFTIKNNERPVVSQPPKPMITNKDAARTE